MPEIAVATPSAGASANQTVAQRLVADLRRHGVEMFIGQSIPSAVTLAGEDDGIRQILVRTEKTGAMIADGYARVSGKVPVVTSLAGPGTPLLMAGLGEAFHASIPMVALLQVVPRQHRDRNYAQDFDDLAALKTVTKAVYYVDRADRVADYVDQAFALAASGRPGPVALLLPPDLLEETAQVSHGRAATYGTYPIDRVSADPSAVREAAALLAGARNPLIVAGGGVHSSGAVEALAWFQDVAGIPVATTLMGKGSVCDTHELSLGLVGYTMGRYALGHYVRPLIDEADVILLVGTRTNQNGTNGWTALPRSARFIHIDVDSREIGRNYEALRVLGDARLTLDALRKEMEAVGLSRCQAGRGERIERIRRGRAEREKDIAALLAADTKPIRPERLMAELRGFVTPETVVCADASYSTVWAGVYLDALRAGMRFITPRGLAGIGWGFPIALGVALARPHQRVVNISGDGGFGYAWSEMETAVRHRIDNIVQIVLNNQVLGYQKEAEDASYGRHTPGLHFAPVDHAAIARACGWRAFRVEEPADLRAALEGAFGAGGPALIDVVSDPRAWPPIQGFEGRLAPSFAD